MVIYKYPLKLQDEQTISVQGFRPLHVGVQNGVICVWWYCNKQSPKRDVTIRIVGTGHEFDGTDVGYIGTVQMDSYVWHVFEVQRN